MFVLRHKIRFIFCLSVVFIPLALFADDSVDMKAGLWEVSASLELPTGESQPLKGTIEHCYTEDYIREMKFPTTSNRDEKDCTITDYMRFANKVTWKQKCEKETYVTDEKGQMKLVRWTETEGAGEVIYKGTSFEITMKYDWYTGGHGTKPVQMINRATGKYIGKCP